MQATRGALQNISDEATHERPIVTYEYIGGRVLTKFLQNGLFLDMRQENEYYFDELGRPEYYDYYYIYNEADPEDEPDWQRDSNFGFTYSYDRAGNKTGQAVSPNSKDSQRYAYDSANRLTSYNRGITYQHNDPCEDLGATWSDQTIARRWALDGLGNWQSLETRDSAGSTSESRLSTTFNEYSKVDGNAQAHDENGNLTFDGNQHYQWDAFNRLRVALDDSLTTLGIYSYDAGNRRMRKVATIDSNTETTDFYYVNWQVLEEMEKTGSSTPTSTTRQFVYGNYIDEPIIMDVNGNPSSDCSTTGSADSRYFYLQNTLYSVYALTDEDQKIVEGYEYDPYGKHVLLTDGNSSGHVDFNASDTRTEQGASGVGSRTAFTGRNFDAEIKSMDFRQRIFLPCLGRFAAPDPSGFVDGANHRAAHFVPNGTDPMGLQNRMPDDGRAECVARAMDWYRSSGAGYEMGLSETEFEQLASEYCENHAQEMAPWEPVPARPPSNGVTPPALPHRDMRNCDHPRPRPGYVPDVNGCGGQGGLVANIVSAVILDEYVFWSFHQGCNNHDRCYQTCRTEQTREAHKHACDLGLRRDLKDECARSFAYNSKYLGILRSLRLFAACNVAAETYYRAVQTFGGSFYDTGQQAACECGCPEQ